MNDGEAERSGTARAGQSGRTAFDWPHDTGTTAAVLREMEVQVGLRRRRRWRVRMASGVLAALVVCVWLWRPEPAQDSATPATTAAVVSAPLRRILPDGSVAVLRGDATVEIDYAADARRVRLVHGEAIFDVRKDPGRPFVVRAASVDVRAIGTEFAVSVQDEAVEVLVTEGEVAVENAPSGDASPAPASAPNRATAGPTESLKPAIAPSEYMVQAGKRIVVQLSPQAPTPEVVAISPEEITQRLGWRVPTLRFSRAPLRDVVAKINQYSRVRLVLDGAALNELPLSGAIRADNVEALLELLATDYGIKAEPRGATEIALRQGR